jgi:hypothetical protein
VIHLDLAQHIRLFERVTIGCSQSNTETPANGNLHQARPIHHGRIAILKDVPNDNPLLGLPPKIYNHDIGTRPDDSTVAS